MDEEKDDFGRHYYIEEIFADFAEYQKYLVKALSLLKDQKKARNPTLEKLVPERLEIHFDKSIKAPRYYIPRFTGIIVLELPDKGYSPKKKAFMRQFRLDSHIGAIKINEISCAEQIAMRMKVMGK